VNRQVVLLRPRLGPVDEGQSAIVELARGQAGSEQFDQLCLRLVLAASTIIFRVRRAAIGLGILRRYNRTRPVTDDL